MSKNGNRNHAMSSSTNLQRYVLPAIAALLAVTAAVVLLAVPKREAASVSALYAQRDGDGNITISASDLSEGELTVLKFAEDSKIELIMTLDNEGVVQAALGTCQSCMGSPGAYYTQNGNLLQCNNCGLTFPMSVIGGGGRGCHPIPIGEEAIKRTADGLVIDSETVAAAEPLFVTVAPH